MGVGDEILAAGQAQRLYDADPSRRVAICDVEGKVRWHPIWEGNPIIARPEDVARGDKVHVLKSGPNCRPYIVYPFTAETGWTFNHAFRARDHIAKIYLTPGERAIGEAARFTYGPYVLIEPYTKHSNLAWSLDRWAQLVEACPDITFVQHTHAESYLVPGAQYEAATFREACALIASAQAYVRSESGLVHAAAALGCPTVTLWGGCTDWDVLGGYPRQIGLVDDGPGSPCGSWKPCDHCRAAMDRITVEQVISALRTIVPAQAPLTVEEFADTVDQVHGHRDASGFHALGMDDEGL